jgi:hypothetical protein
MSRWSQCRGLWAATLFIAALALSAIVVDHRSHVLGVLPYLVLLACPLLHLRHAGRHGPAVHSGSRSDRSHAITSAAGNARDGGDP